MIFPINLKVQERVFLLTEGIGTKYVSDCVMYNNVLLLIKDIGSKYA